MQRRLNEWLSGRMNSSSSLSPSEIEFRPSSPEVQLLTSLRERAKARTNEFGALFFSFLFFKGGVGVGGLFHGTLHWQEKRRVGKGVGRLRRRSRHIECIT